MSEHKVSLRWERGDAAFEYQKYPRNHTWKFDGGHEMTATAAPAYLGDPKNVWIRKRPSWRRSRVVTCLRCWRLRVKKFVLDEYMDEAVGHMEKNAEGKMAITKVHLHPKLKFSGDNQPTDKDLDEMHHFAHENCFIANSVKTEVTVEK